MPKLLQNNVVSISSAHMATTLLVVKNNGEIYEIARNAYPLVLMEWSKPNIKILKKKVIAAQCARWGKLLQHDDKTWTIWKSRRGFQQQILQEISNWIPSKPRP